MIHRNRPQPDGLGSGSFRRPDGSGAERLRPPGHGVHHREKIKRAGPTAWRSFGPRRMNVSLWHPSVIELIWPGCQCQPANWPPATGLADSVWDGYTACAGVRPLLDALRAAVILSKPAATRRISAVRDASCRQRLPQHDACCFYGGRDGRTPGLRSGFAASSIKCYA